MRGGCARTRVLTVPRGSDVGRKALANDPGAGWFLLDRHGRMSDDRTPHQQEITACPHPIVAPRFMCISTHAATAGW
ncbi:hypothetical protein GCM10022284_61980 [Streptomyces hundungensis]